MDYKVGQADLAAPPAPDAAPIYSQFTLHPHLGGIPDMPEAAQCDAGRCVLSSLSVSSPSEVPPWYTCGGRGGGGRHMAAFHMMRTYAPSPLFLPPLTCTRSMIPPHAPPPPHMHMVNGTVSVNIGMKAARGKVKLADGAACRGGME